MLAQSLSGRHRPGAGHAALELARRPPADRLIAFVAATLAENNVTPFDIVEAESRIVVGFHVEHSGMKFALFFLAEFASTSPERSWAILSGAAGTAVLRPRDAAVPLRRARRGSSCSPSKRSSASRSSSGCGRRCRACGSTSLMDFGWKFLIPLTLANLLTVGAQIAFRLPLWTLFIPNWGILSLASPAARRRSLRRCGGGVWRSPGEVA